MIETADAGSARARLLAAADELFYEGGIHTVGIDTIIRHAGVAKASLYSTFGSKDELVRAYLEGRDEARRARVLDEVERHTDPVERLVAVFESVATSVARPGFRGCAFANAAGESEPDSVAAVATRRARSWMNELLTDLAAAAGARDPAALADQLALLYDGTLVQSRVGNDPSRGTAVVAAARTLIAASLPV